MGSSNCLCHSCGGRNLVHLNALDSRPPIGVEGKLRGNDMRDFPLMQQAQESIVKKC